MVNLFIMVKWYAKEPFPVNINYCYYVLQKTKSINTIVSLRPIINGDVKLICYDSKDVIPPSLRSISKNYYNTLSPLYTQTKERDNIMD